MEREQQGEITPPRDVSTDAASVVFEARIPGLSPQQTFAHWTDPALLRDWWSPEADVEPWQGGAYHLAWPGMDWHLRGTYTAWDPPGRLAFTWRWDHLPPESEKAVEVRIQPGTRGSELRLTHGQYTQSRLDQEYRDEHVAGWQHFLARLQACIVIDRTA